MQRQYAACGHPLLSDVNAANALLSRGALGVSASYAASATYSYTLERTAPQTALALLEAAVAARNVHAALGMMGTLLKEYNSYPNTVADALFRLYDATNAFSTSHSDGGRPALAISQTVEFLIDAARTPQQQVAIAYGFVERLVQRGRWDAAQEALDTLRHRDLYTGDSRVFYYSGLIDLGRWRDSVVLGVRSGHHQPSVTSAAVKAPPPSRLVGTAGRTGNSGKGSRTAKPASKHATASRISNRYADDYDDDDDYLPYDDEEDVGGHNVDADDDDGGNAVGDLEALLLGGLPGGSSGAPAKKAASAAPSKAAGQKKAVAALPAKRRRVETSDDEDDDEDDDDSSSASVPSRSTTPSSPSEDVEREADVDDPDRHQHPLKRALAAMAPADLALLQSARANFCRVLELAKGGKAPLAYQLPAGVSSNHDDEGEEVDDDGADDSDDSNSEGGDEPKKKRRGRPKGSKDRKKRRRKNGQDDGDRTLEQVSASLSQLLQFPPSTQQGGTSYGAAFNAVLWTGHDDTTNDHGATNDGPLALKAALLGLGLPPPRQLLSEKGAALVSATDSLSERCSSLAALIAKAAPVPVVAGNQSDKSVAKQEKSARKAEKRARKAARKASKRLETVLECLLAATVEPMPALTDGAGTSTDAATAAKGKQNAAKAKPGSSTGMIEAPKVYKHFPQRNRHRWRLETPLEEVARNLILSVGSTAFGASSTPSLLSLSSFSACHMSTSLARAMALERALLMAPTTTASRNTGNGAAEALIPLLHYGNPFLFRCFQLLRQLEQHYRSSKGAVQRPSADADAAPDTVAPSPNDTLARACAFAPSFLSSGLPAAFRSLVDASAAAACFPVHLSGKKKRKNKASRRRSASAEEEGSEAEDVNGKEAAPAEVAAAPPIVLSILPPLAAAVAPAPLVAAQADKRELRARQGASKKPAHEPQVELVLEAPAAASLDIRAAQAKALRRHCGGLLKRDARADSGAGLLALLHKQMRTKGHAGKKSSGKRGDDDDGEEDEHGAQFPFSLSGPSFGDYFRLGSPACLMGTAAGTAATPRIPAFRSLVTSLEANVGAFQAAAMAGTVDGKSVCDRFDAAGVSCFGFMLPVAVRRQIAKAAEESPLDLAPSSAKDAPAGIAGAGAASGHKRLRHSNDKESRASVLSRWQPHPSAVLHLLMRSPSSPLSLLSYLAQLTALCSLNGQSHSVVVRRANSGEEGKDEEKDDLVLWSAPSPRSQTMATRAVRLLIEVARDQLGVEGRFLAALLAGGNDAQTLAALKSLVEGPIISSFSLPPQWLARVAAEGAVPLLGCALASVKASEERLTRALKEPSCLPLSAAATITAVLCPRPVKQGTEAGGTDPLSPYAASLDELSRALLSEKSDDADVDDDASDSDGSSLSTDSSVDGRMMIIAGLPHLRFGAEYLEREVASASSTVMMMTAAEEHLATLTPAQHIALARLAVLLMLKELVAA